jgi:hypothetical protein
MVTNEYDALTLVLSSGYRCHEISTGILKMEETDPGLPLQSISLRTEYKDVEGFMLYRLEDRGEKLLQPILNHNNVNDGAERKSPKYLVCMCDYMSVCSYKDKTYVFLYELKRGKATDYQKQLDAGECLLNYLCDTIDRIKLYDGIAFDRNLIQIKKFQIKQIKSNKQTIQPELSVSENGPYFKVETNNELWLLRLLNS